MRLVSLKRGIVAMKALPDSDPRSWHFQANIHGTIDPVTNPLFNQCEHHTLQCLAWHRGYLYTFRLRISASNFGWAG
jgi:Common central domain of tyrosinase